MKWIALCLTLFALAACDNPPPATPTAPAPAVQAPAPDAAPAAAEPAPAAASAAAEPTPEEAGAAALDDEPAPATDPPKATGMLPEPDFKLKGPELAAPTSGPSDSAGPKLIELDLKKE